MKYQSFPLLLLLLLLQILTSKQCLANSSQPITQFPQTQTTHKQWLNFVPNLHEMQMKLTTPFILAGLLCFIASSISSAGGIGGGGLFIPILKIVAGLDLKTASSFSSFMVTGGSIANVVCGMFFVSSKNGGIDYDIALLSEPCMLLGVSIGVICNVVFPEWLVTLLFAVFLAWSTFKTFKSGVLYWKLESEKVGKNGFGNSENGFGVGDAKQALLGEEVKEKVGFPWTKLGMLVLVWFCFLIFYLLRGNRYGESMTSIEPCGVGYWILSAFQIPLALIFTAWILYNEETSNHYQGIKDEEEEEECKKLSNKLKFPGMAMLAGVLGGLFGIGGGMLISPILLQLGIPPQVTAATCSVMVFFSSTMSAIQYLLMGMEHIEVALIFSMVCLLASLVGLMVVKGAIDKYGRASLIVFSVGVVMALSTVLITSFGALDVYTDYISGKSMWFKRPC